MESSKRGTMCRILQALLVSFVYIDDSHDLCILYDPSMGQVGKVAL